VAHLLAERLSLPVLSVDSMQVYRGLDIGTAKPTPEERARHRYYGLDLADPGEHFSVAQYRAAVWAELRARPVSAVIACGGSGLYFKALRAGLTPAPPSDPARRAEGEALLAAEGLPGLQARVRAAGLWSALPEGDQRNPRRLLRALERGSAGAAADRSVGPRPPGLWLKREALWARLRRRAEAMFAQGLLEEAARWRGRLGTAGQAIGYAEAEAVLDGRMSRTEAVEHIALRSRQYAKRQLTWLRGQERAVLLERGGAESDTELADRVQAVWEAEGPIPLRE
jgi:tRNA dimethylallyltransferase